MDLKILVIGDVVGNPGRDVIQKKLPALVEAEGIDFVVANAENLAGGSGVTEPTLQEIFRAGVDVATSGDHSYSKKEGIPFLSKSPRVVRPANYPEEAAGRGFTVLPSRRGTPIAVIHLVGRVFMPPVDCPFRCADRTLKLLPPDVKAIVVDMHGEATSEKVAMGRYLDGRVSAVLGSHTHIQTADEHVLPGGTAYLTDLGMTGPYDSVIGRRVDRVLSKFLTGMPAVFEVADRDVRLCGAIVTIDGTRGTARAIRRVSLLLEDSSTDPAAKAAVPGAAR